MEVCNHFGEPVTVVRLRRYQSAKYQPFAWVKARLASGQTEYWDYDMFQGCNPGFDWSAWE